MRCHKLHLRLSGLSVWLWRPCWTDKLIFILAVKIPYSLIKAASNSNSIRTVDTQNKRNRLWGIKQEDIGNMRRTLRCCWCWGQESWHPARCLGRSSFPQAYLTDLNYSLSHIHQEIHSAQHSTSTTYPARRDNWFNAFWFQSLVRLTYKSWNCWRKPTKSTSVLGEASNVLVTMLRFLCASADSHWEVTSH